jgi:alkyl sulfatase BDS1-like metallo-beta-lactamase superfamily hydrolase
MSHHWPRFGHDQAMQFMRVQRDVYRYVHDQTMRLANLGETAIEIAEQLALPSTLQHTPHVRDYYGTLNHNAKAVYQRYLGWFDANPAHLHQLPPVEAGRRYVELAGGADELLAKARTAYDEGDYRWVAELVNHLVFADPDNVAAKALQADALEQLGYRAESGPWRDFYLTGAQELRAGHLALPGYVSLDTIRAMTPEMLCDLWAIRLNGAAADGRSLRVNIEITDLEESRLVELTNATLRSAAGQTDPEAPTLVTTHLAFALLVSETTPLDELLLAGDIAVRGNDAPFRELFALLDTFTLGFPIVTP